eukprot:jgi/Hompol1/1669/HPOL_002323-RA
MSQMKHQMQRVIEYRKKNPKEREAELSLVGALGKISSSTARKPKKAIQVVAGSPSTDNKMAASSGAALSPLTVLKAIETIYSAVLTLEHLKRIEDHDAPLQTIEEWNIKFQEGRMELWSALRISEAMLFSTENLFVCTLNYNKGARVLSRVFRFLDSDQILGVVSTLLVRFECVAVSNVETGANTQEIDAFIGHVVPLLVNVVSESPLMVIISLARIILERHNMVWFAKSRVGLAILTMLLSRAEILKQGAGGASIPTDEELAMWAEIYGFLFKSMQGSFSTLFPSNPTSSDSIYVWQFMAAMAVSASGIEHQRILVTEAREHVMYASQSGDPKALDNVNLFLNALGLGVSAAELAGRFN